MRTWETVELKNTETGETFTRAYGISLDQLKRIRSGELEIVRYELHKEPPTMTLCEVRILQAYDKKEKIPSTFKDILKTAKKKRKEIHEYQRQLKRLGGPDK